VAVLWNNGIMEYKEEKKECQSCKKDFTIEPDDFSFYEKIQVPPPTFCPECRFQRRMTWRNERSLYKSICGLCNKNIISMYPKDSIFPVYCRECWYSDKWDATDYGQDFDFSRPFFEQFKILSSVVPKLALWQRNVIDSDYSNMCGECKNVYLSTSVVLGSENIFYSKTVDKSFNIFDCLNIRESDNCYECIEGEKNYNSQHLLLSRNCMDSYFLVDCSNCNNCIFCSNLRNKEFCIRNTQYSKEEYFKKLELMNLGSRNSRKKFVKEFDKLSKKAIYKYANIIKSINSSGNNLFNVSNCLYCFDSYNAENLKYCYRCLNHMKDSMDVFFSANSEMLYEYTTGSLNDYNVKFSYSAMNTVRNSEYLESCMSSLNIFGCISIKSKENIILNKQYTKEEYENLLLKIKKHMNDMPYVDKGGRIYRYGEFFPIELSPFAYNETSVQDFFPLNKYEVLKQGYKWKEKEEKNYNVDTKTNDIPDDIKNVTPDILNKVIECSHKDCDHQCTEAFKITRDEFQFYKKYNIPLPDECSNCRYYERFRKVPPPKLWHRKCMKEGCLNEFDTPYAPDRPEIIYCEKCYQNEVI
jgi:hypothetical protein